MSKKKGSSRRGDDFLDSDIEDNHIKDGAWKTFKSKKGGNSYTNTRSAASKAALKSRGTSAVFEVMGEGVATAGGNSGAAAASIVMGTAGANNSNTNMVNANNSTNSSSTARLASSAAIAKLEESFIGSRAVVSLDAARSCGLAEEREGGVGTCVPTMAGLYEEVFLVDCVVKTIVRRIAECLVVDGLTRPAAAPAEKNVVVRVAFLLLGVGELDNAPSNLQMAFGLAVARELHGRQMRFQQFAHAAVGGNSFNRRRENENRECDVEAPLPTPKQEAADDDGGELLLTVLIDSLVTYDPMVVNPQIHVSSVGHPQKEGEGERGGEETQDEREQKSKNAATATTGADPLAKKNGIEGLISRWNAQAHERRAAYEKQKKASPPPPPPAHTREGNRPLFLLPPLPSITYDSVNRYGAYSPKVVEGFSSTLAATGRTSDTSVDVNEEHIDENNDTPSPPFIVAYTPHCPRALYHNLVLASASDTNGVPEAGQKESVESKSMTKGDSEQKEGVRVSSSSFCSLRRLIIMGNDITGYTRHDRKCVLEGLVEAAAAEGSSGRDCFVARSDLRTMVLNAVTGPQQWKHHLFSCESQENTTAKSSMCSTITNASGATNSSRNTDELAYPEEAKEYFSGVRSASRKVASDVATRAVGGTLKKRMERTLSSHCAMSVTVVEKLMFEVGSEAAAKQKIEELRRNLPNASKIKNNNKNDDRVSGLPAAEIQVRTNAKFMTIQSRGKYGSHTTAEAERAFGDLSIVSFGPASAEIFAALPPSRKRLITSGDDLL